MEFPAAAQGWIALRCSGLSEEQRAIVKAKSQGKLELSEVSSALRSCFPQYRATSKAKKPVTSAMVVEEREAEEMDHNDEEFGAVHCFDQRQDQAEAPRI